MSAATTAGGATAIMTIDEVAELTRTPAATLRYWRHVGKGPASYKIGRHVVYDRPVVEAWLNAQRGQAKDAAAQLIQDARRAVDKPAELARAVLIVRAALGCERLTLADLTALPTERAS